MESETGQVPEPACAGPASLGGVFIAFAKIGLTSFGGGMSGWMLREFVQRRKWLTEDAFMNGVSIAQSFPGVNVVNLSIWIGYQWRGTRGALLASLGIVVPPMIIALIMMFVFEQLADFATTRIALAGVAAGAVGLSFNMGFRALYRSARRVMPAVFAVVAFAAIFLFNLPLYMVVLTLAPLSIAYSYWRIQKRGAR